MNLWHWSDPEIHNIGYCSDGLRNVAPCGLNQPLFLNLHDLSFCHPCLWALWAEAGSIAGLLHDHGAQAKIVIIRWTLMCSHQPDFNKSHSKLHTKVANPLVFCDPSHWAFVWLVMYHCCGEPKIWALTTSGPWLFLEYFDFHNLSCELRRSKLPLV